MYESPDGRLWRSSRDYEHYASQQARAQQRVEVEQLPVIQGFSRYVISADGRIFNRSRALEVRPTFVGGYARVSLVSDDNRHCTRSLARLVAMHYLDLPGEDAGYLEARPKDGNPANLRADNLEWYPRWKRNANQLNYEVDI